MLAKPIAAACRVPVVINHDHCNDKLTDLPEMGAPGGHVDEPVLHAPDRRLGIHHARFVVEHEGVPADRATTIHNGIDCEAFQPRPERRAAARAALGIPFDAWVVGGIGRLTHQKNFALFLETAATVLARHPSAYFVIAGTGEDDAALRAQADRLGISERVKFLGFVGDMAALYPALDTLLLTSRYEGHPITILEAMAAGVPIVASRLDGIAEMLTDGVDAALVMPGDHAGFADAVGRFLENSALAEECAEAALAKVRAQFSAQRMARECEAIYLRYLEPSH